MEATSMEEVERLAAEPAYRWFPDPDGVRWESRIVVPDPPDRLLIKFISWTAGVFEGPYPFENGLGIRTDDELVNLLSQLRVVGD